MASTEKEAKGPSVDGERSRDKQEYPLFAYVYFSEFTRKDTSTRNIGQEQEEKTKCHLSVGVTEPPPLQGGPFGVATNCSSFVRDRIFILDVLMKGGRHRFGTR